MAHIRYILVIERKRSDVPNIIEIATLTIDGADGFDPQRLVDPVPDQQATSLIQQVSHIAAAMRQDGDVQCRVTQLLQSESFMHLCERGVGSIQLLPMRLTPICSFDSSGNPIIL